MVKKPGGLINLANIPEEIDPSINATLQAGQRRQAAAHLPTQERRRKAKEARKSQERKGRRAAYDLNPNVIEAVQQLADDYHTTASQIAALGLALLINGVRSGEVTIDEYLKPAKRNPRYENLLEVPELYKK